MMITQFRDNAFFLSNFYPCVIVLDEDEYPTVEHAFQAAKTFDVDERYKVRTASSPATAKRLGRQVTLRSDWETVKVGILEDLVRQKFTRHDDLRQQLLATGQVELIEGNTWNDRFYGAVWNEKKGQWVGQNHLGKILMKIRAEVREITLTGSE